MPEHLRALVVILGLALPVFWIAKRVFCPDVMAVGDFVRRRNVWLVLTLSAFLSHSYWVFLVIAVSLLWWAGNPRRERNPLALFFFVMFAVPGFAIELPTFGILESLFDVTLIRLITWLVLLPAALRLRRNPSAIRLGSTWSDRFLICYLLLMSVQYIIALPMTQAMRAIFYLVGDSLIIFYVASRSITRFASLREAASAYCMALLMMSPIVVFEFGKSWLLYATLDSALGLNWSGAQYLGREGLLRATGSAGHSLVLGYALAVGLGLWMGLQRTLTPRSWWAGAIALCAALISPVSRGPWVGALLIAAVAAATGRGSGSRIFKLGLGAAAVVGGVAMSPYGGKLVGFVPVVRSVDEFNVSYRQLLLDVSLKVIGENPLFGTADFLSNPLMEQLRQGQGIIDLVNSYLSVALYSGILGLTSFLGVFVFCMFPMLNAIRRAGNLSLEAEAAGRSLLAVLLGIMLMIATVSSIFAIPTIYWAMCGLALAYARTVHLETIAIQQVRQKPHASNSGVDQVAAQGTSMYRRTT